MGSRAKRAINAAESAIEEVSATATQLAEHYDELMEAKNHSLEKKMEFGTYVAKAHPGQDDFRPLAQADPKVADLLREIAAASRAVDEKRASCLADHEELTQGRDGWKAAVSDLAELITEKRAQRNKPTKNLLKKIANRAKTKSLGDLQAELEKIQATGNDVELALTKVRIKDFQ